MYSFNLTAGRCYGPPASFGITSSVPSFLPSSFSPAALPITFTSPQCCNILPSNSFLTYRAYCSICLSKLSSCTALRPVLDLPFMTALQVKKGDSCRSRWLQDSTTRSTSEHPVHSISAGWDSGDYQAQKDNREPAFVSSYNYSFPLSHHFPLSMFTKCP